MEQTMDHQYPLRFPHRSPMFQNLPIRAILLALLFSYGSQQCSLCQGAGWFDRWQPGSCDASHDCDSGGCDSGGCDRMSGRAFLFAWPGSSVNDMRLNLSEPLITDRPDFTEASSTVGYGVTQFELGYTYAFDNDGTDQAINPWDCTACSSR